MKRSPHLASFAPLEQFEPASHVTIFIWFFKRTDLWVGNMRLGVPSMCDRQHALYLCVRAAQCLEPREWANPRYTFTFECMLF